MTNMELTVLFISLNYFTNSFNLTRLTSGALTSNSGGREAIYQDLMSTISAAASTLSDLQATEAPPPQTPAPASATATKRETKEKAAKDLPAEQADEQRLCTFTTTKKEFMNQHWYYCHTCQMTERIGMCTVCAKVCHKGHDVSYAKYGSFFCDCGAKEDGSCRALVKRPAADKAPRQVAKRKVRSKRARADELLNTNEVAKSGRNFLASNIPIESTIELLRRINEQAAANRPRQLEKLRGQLVECVRSKGLLTSVRRLVDKVLLPMAKRVYDGSLLNSGGLTSRRLMAQMKRRRLAVPGQEAGDEEAMLSGGKSFADSSGCCENVKM